MFDKVKKMIADKLNIEADTIKLDSNLIDDLGADSIDSVELIMDIEDEYNVEVSDEQIKNIKTVQDIVSFIESLEK